MLLREPSAPVGNAVIFTDQRGRLWIVWGRMEARQPLLAHTGWERTRLLYRISDDNGYTWSKDRLFPLETTGWLPRNLPIKLATGELVLPLSDERNNTRLIVLCNYEGLRANVGQIGSDSQLALARRTTDSGPAPGRIAACLSENHSAPAADRVVRPRDDLEPGELPPTSRTPTQPFRCALSRTETCFSRGTTRSADGPHCTSRVPSMAARRGALR